MVSMLPHLLIFEETWCRTESYIVIHTWRSPPRFISDDEYTLFLGKLHPTVPDTKNPPKCPDRVLDRADIRTKVLCSISDLLPCLDELRNRRIRDFDIGKILIIFHEDIVLRSEMLDEIGLEDQCLDLSTTSDDLDIGDLAYHLSLRERELARLHEVALHAQSQALRFPDIHDFPSLILHLVNSWRFWEIFEYFFDVL